LKKIVLDRKSQSDFIFCYSVRFIDHSVGNQFVETSVLEFSKNQNFWGCACTPAPPASAPLIEVVGLYKNLTELSC